MDFLPSTYEVTSEDLLLSVEELKREAADVYFVTYVTSEESFGLEYFLSCWCRELQCLRSREMKCSQLIFETLFLIYSRFPVSIPS